MADEPQVLRGIDWRSTFPFTLIFRSFRIAIHPSKLFLALAALFLIYAGGRVLDQVWKLRPQYRAVPGELRIFEETRDTANPIANYNQQRNDLRRMLGQRHDEMLKEAGHYPNGDTDDIEYYIKQNVRRDVAAIHDRFDKAPAEQKPEAKRRRDLDLRLTYDDGSARLRAANDFEGYGLFDTFFGYEVGQINSIVRAVRTGNWFGDAGVGGALVRFFMWGPLWAIGRHPIFFTIFGLYFLTIWSIFGGAISRIAAVHVAREEKISIRQALAFSMNKFLSFVSAPIIPLLIVLIVGLVVALGGLVGNIPGIGPILVGAFFFLALAAGFIMTLVLLGLVGGFNLMYPTIAVEGSDSFDAISRSFSYLYARPWRLAFYTLVAIIYGSLCYLFVRFFIYLLLWLSHEFVGLWFVYPAENAAPLFNVMWPDPYTHGRLIYDVDWLVLTPMQSLGARLIA
ncbi:MAG: hypothetical protein H7Z14_04105, partial [Anaerolineae bacterium]|nr:hypothetical protein [Phycisphaerae bacterium]